MRAALAKIAAILLCFAGSAEANLLSYQRIGGPLSRQHEITGLTSEMTNDALDAEALRACPRGYQPEEETGFEKPDGSSAGRFTFYCLNPSERSDRIGTKVSSGGEATITFPPSGTAPSRTTILDRKAGIAYELELVADPDTAGHPVVVDLALRRRHGDEI